jgi:hypothetical protein
MIMYLLDRAFDVNLSTEIGLIKTHFPTHNFSVRKNISQSWKKNFMKTLLEPLSLVFIEKAILPIKRIAFYHGIQNGFYFGFLVTFTSFLIPLSLMGILAYLYDLLIKSREGFPNVILLPFTQIVTSIWMSLFFIAWKRREKLLSY